MTPASAITRLPRSATQIRAVRAFTLLEVITAIIVVGLMMGVTIPTVNSITNVKQRSAAQQVAGNIKHLYDRAILERIYIRLVIDLEQDAYWSESTKDPVFLALKPLDVDRGGIIIRDEEDEKKQEEEEEKMIGQDSSILFDDPNNYKWQGWTEFANKFRKKRPQFSTYKTELTNRTALPDGVQFYKVMTEGVAKPVEAGQIFIHFFPNGFVERSALYLVKTSDLEDEELYPEDYEIYTVMVEPLTGRSAIYDTLVDLPQEREDEEQR